MTNYFGTSRGKYNEDGIGVYRNHEDIGRDPDDEVFFIGGRTRTFSRDTARKIADALYEVADEWDDAERRHAEANRPTAKATLEMTDRDHPGNEGVEVNYYGEMTVEPYGDGVEITIREVSPCADERAFVVLTAEQVQTLKDFLG